MGSGETLSGGGMCRIVCVGYGNQGGAAAPRLFKCSARDDLDSRLELWQLHSGEVWFASMPRDADIAKRPFPGELKYHLLGGMNYPRRALPSAARQSPWMGHWHWVELSARVMEALVSDKKASRRAPAAYRTSYMYLYASPPCNSFHDGSSSPCERH